MHVFMFVAEVAARRASLKARGGGVRGTFQLVSKSFENDLIYAIHQKSYNG